MTDEDNTPESPDSSGEETAPAAQRLRLSWGGATHPGQVRPVNQDALFADRGLFVVADGMGGHQAGEVASRISVKTLAGRNHGSVDELVDGVDAANVAVWEHASSASEFKGMGTTLTALAVIGDGRPPRLGLVNVGDSRVYRLREGELEQLTDDHSYVAELVRRGQISETEAETHPYRNMLTRAIGVSDTIEVDRWEMAPVAGDLFLLCSDGLVNELDDETIRELIEEYDDPTEAARELIAGANRAGGRDNITVVIVKVDVEEIAEPEAVPTDAALSPLETGVISPYTGAAETAEMEGLVEDVAALEPEPETEGSDPLALLTELEADLASVTAVIDPQDLELADEPVVPPSKPVDALADYDLPKLEGDDALLPWLTSEQPEVSEPDESDSAATDVEPVSTAEDTAAAVVQGGGVVDDVENAAESARDAEPTETTQVIASTPPINPFLDPVTASGPIDHFAPAVRGWKAPVAVTWRSLLFVSVVMAIIVGAVVLVGWYARSAYYVGYSGDEVVIYQGRPDGVLWFDPTLEEGSGIYRQDLNETVALQIDALYETSTIEGARAFIEEVRPPDQDAGEPEVAVDTVESTTTLP